MRAAREFVVKQLREHLPTTWRVVDTMTMPETLDRLTVIVDVTSVRRAPDAPMGAYDTTVTLTLASPNDDFARAEAELEEALELLVLAIEDHFGTAWDATTKVTFDDRYLAHTVPIHVYTSRKD